MAEGHPGMVRKLLGERKGNGYGGRIVVNVVDVGRGQGVCEQK